jgi:hypothetical protein
MGVAVMGIALTVGRICHKEALKGEGQIVV